MPRPTAVVVDDHEGFRTLAIELLREVGYDVVASCSDGRSGLASVAETAPDLLLLDVQLPDLDGFAVLDALRASGTGTTVVLVSTREAADYGGRISVSGVAGFISKGDLTPAALADLVP